MSKRLPFATSRAKQLLDLALMKNQQLKQKNAARRVQSWLLEHVSAHKILLYIVLCYAEHIAIVHLCEIMSVVKSVLRVSVQCLSIFLC